MVAIGALLAPVAVGMLATKALSFCEKHHELHSDVKGKLKTLGGLLLKLKCVVEVADGKMFQSPATVELLEDFNNLVYQVDDLLDTFEYRELQANSSSMIRRGIHGIRNLVTLRQGDLSKLSSLIKKLEEHVRFMNIVETINVNQQLQQLPTVTPKKNKHSFVGREKEKKEIIDFLLNTKSRRATNVSVLSIVGDGGIGKTALAQEVYNDSKVKSHFSLKMWVCVSNNFDVGSITIDMLDQLQCPYGHIGLEKFDELQVILMEKLRSQRFLLVLDNVRTESIFIEVYNMLCRGKEGSKILLTSREKEFAIWMRTMQRIKLQGLPKDKYWSFFSECAFGDAHPEEHLELAAVGRKIALKLKGSPLAAMAVGELLTYKLNYNHWESILKGIWELEQGRQDIMSVLKVSYLHLPFHLKQCFSYLSVTPKDWELVYSKVIGMWMAHGMFYCHDRMKKIEDVVEDYYNRLISMSFFQLTVKEDMYTLHDLLHDLAEDIHKDYSFRIEHDNVREIPTAVRHLSLSTKNLVALKGNAYVLNNLRTLLFLHNYEVNFNDADIKFVLKKLKSIRVLSLSHCHMEKLPNDLSHLIHLRYLDLSHTGIKELPDGVTKLYHLQLLNLFRLELDRVPPRMNKLINLRSLICSERTLSMVEGIGEMTKLQELMCSFSVQNVPEFGIAQLGNLKELGGCLCVRNLENVDGEEQAKEAKLCDKDNIVELVLHWESVDNPEVANGILEGLQPHGNLKKLHIDGYNGTQFPSWLVHLNNLINLKLTNCRDLNGLPALGQLPRLEVLEISGMHAIKQVGNGFHGSGVVTGFPSLRELIFESLPNWKDWSAYDVNLFPCLQNLRISECPNLTKIPPLPATLERLQLFNLRWNEFQILLTEAGTSISPSSSSSTSSSSSPSSSSSSSLSILPINGVGVNVAILLALFLLLLLLLLLLVISLKLY